MATYKNPLDLANALNQKPPFDKKAIVSYLQNFGTGDTDDAYEKWAKSKGKELKKTPLDPKFIGTSYHKQYYGADRDYTYADQYLNDDEWLQEAWNDLGDDALDWMNQSSPRGYQSKDEDFEMSWGPEDKEGK